MTKKKANSQNNILSDINTIGGHIENMFSIITTSSLFMDFIKKQKINDNNELITNIATWLSYEGIKEIVTVNNFGNKPKEVWIEMCTSMQKNLLPVCVTHWKTKQAATKTLKAFYSKNHEEWIEMFLGHLFHIRLLDIAANLIKIDPIIADIAKKSKADKKSCSVIVQWFSEFLVGIFAKEKVDSKHPESAYFNITLKVANKTSDAVTQWLQQNCPKALPLCEDIIQKRIDVWYKGYIKVFDKK